MIKIMISGEYIELIVSQSVSASTRGTRLYWLRRIEREVGDLNSITVADIRAWLARYPHWAPATRRTISYLLGHYFRWALEVGRVEVDPTRRLVTPRVPRGIPRPAPPDVVAQALAAAAPRQRAMILLALMAGLRREEISRLKVSDRQDELLRITGKGGVVRILPVRPELAEALDALRIPHGFYFPRYGKVGAAPVRSQTVGIQLSKLLGPGWSAHTLRHAAGTTWLETCSGDLIVVRDLLGHSDVGTTQVYARAARGKGTATVLAADWSRVL